MKIYDKIKLTLALVCASVVWAQAADDSRVEEVAFSHAAVSIEGGEVYPFGNLVDAVENTYYGGFGFRYAYWENVDGIVMFDYSYFKPIPEAVPYYGVHQFTGKVGLDYRWPLIRPVVLGGGFVCNWTRADLGDDIDENEIYGKPGGTLGDNETEFGWFARMNVVLWNFEKYRIGFNFMWEELWTLPKRSNMLYAGLYVERKLW